MKSIAIVTIRKPGALTAEERERIADWLQQQAKNLRKDGADYNDTGNFTARYGRVKS